MVADMAALKTNPWLTDEGGLPASMRESIQLYPHKYRAFLHAPTPDKEDT